MIMIDRYIATKEFNKLTSENFDERLKQANLASKKGIADFRKKIQISAQDYNFFLDIIFFTGDDGS